MLESTHTYLKSFFVSCGWAYLVEQVWPVPVNWNYGIAQAQTENGNVRLLYRYWKALKNRKI